MLAAVAVLSAAALGYEILLTRLLSIVQWHHFAFLAISVALLGFGASGTFLLVLGDRIRTGIEPFLALTALAFGLAAPVSFVIAERVPFNVLDAPWSPGSLGWLLVIELLLAVPFFFAATGIGRALVVFRHRLSRVYAADLAGAGAGAAAAVGVLYLVPAERALDLVCGLGAVAGLLAVGVGGGSSPGRRPLLVLCAAVLVLSGFGVTGELRISPFKPLPQSLRVTGAKLAETRTGPLGMVSAVENREVPLRSAPGLSLLARAPVPEQVALFVDADGPVPIVRHEASSSPPAYLAISPPPCPTVWWSGPGCWCSAPEGGAAVLQALGAGSPVRGCGGDPARCRRIGPRPLQGALGRGVRAPGGQCPCRRPARVRRSVRRRVRPHPGHRPRVEHRRPARAGGRAAADGGGGPGGARPPVRRRRGRVHRPDPASPARRGPPACDGARCNGCRVGRDVRGPPRVDQKLEHQHPGGRPGAAVGERVEAVRAFAGARAFDLIHVPGMAPGDANRFNVLDRPYFHEAAQWLLGGRRQVFLRDYKFDIRPATDDRPWFRSFFRWAHAGEILRLSRQGGIGLLDVGYLALPAALVQAVAASAALILLPLLAVRRERGGARRWPALAGFFCIGLAFLLVEIAFIGRFTVILSHPVQALVVVLAGFLVFAGVGSHLSVRSSSAASITGPVVGIARHRHGLRAPFAVADLRPHRCASRR